MRIAYILSGKNGITSFTFRELELLESKGLEFCLCFTKLNMINNIPKKQWKYIVASKSRIVFSAIKVLFSIKKIRLMLNAIKHNELKWLLVANDFVNNKSMGKIDCIHVQMSDQKLIIGYYLKSLLNLNSFTCTIHAHELYSEMRYENLKRLRDVLCSCKTIFTISEYNRKILVDDFKLPASKIKVMYLYPSFEADLSIMSKVKFLVTANWERKKGYEEIIQAVKRMNREDFVVLIAGRNVNPEVDLDLKSIIKNEGLESKIILLGHLNMAILKILYSVCDVFMLPSKTEYYDNGKVKEREGIPVALMEAMSFGLPIISTKHAGIPELVQEYLIEEGDASALENAMCFLIDNLEQCKKDAEANVFLVNSKFSKANIDVLVNEICK
jgi:glycosyltransferase involved in cell wall biosynthesis